MAAIVAAIFATMVVWWNLGLPRVVFSPELAPINGPRLFVADNPAIENADRITIEAWVNTLSWPTRAVVCRKDGPPGTT